MRNRKNWSSSTKNGNIKVIVFRKMNEQAWTLNKNACNFEKYSNGITWYFVQLLMNFYDSIAADWGEGTFLPLLWTWCYGTRQSFSFSLFRLSGSVCLCMMRTINLMFSSRLTVDVPASNIYPPNQTFLLELTNWKWMEWIKTSEIPLISANRKKKRKWKWRYSMNSDACFIAFRKCDVISVQFSSIASFFWDIFELHETNLFQFTIINKDRWCHL